MQWIANKELVGTMAAQSISISCLLVAQRALWKQKIMCGSACATVTTISRQGSYKCPFVNIQLHLVLGPTCSTRDCDLLFALLSLRDCVRRVVGGRGSMQVAIFHKRARELFTPSIHFDGQRFRLLPARKKGTRAVQTCARRMKGEKTVRRRVWPSVQVCQQKRNGDACLRRCCLEFVQIFLQVAAPVLRKKQLFSWRMGIACVTQGWFEDTQHYFVLKESRSCSALATYD